MNNHRYKKITFSGDSGNSLVATLVAIAIGIVVLGALGVTVTSSMNQMRAVMDRAELRDIRILLATRIDCKRTKDAAVASVVPFCDNSQANGQFIALLTKSGAELVNKYNGGGPNTVFGPFQIRVKCLAPFTPEPQYLRRSGTWTPLFDSDVPFACVYP